MADKIAIMYLGKIMEYGDAQQIFKEPCHPYTKALFAAIPSMEEKKTGNMDTLESNVPSAINIPSGCRFHTRCPSAMECCKTEEPKLIKTENDILVACHLIVQKPLLKNSQDLAQFEDA